MIEQLLVQYAEVSLSVSAAILLLMAVGPLLGRRYGYGWRCLLWVFLALRLLIPLSVHLPKAPIVLTPPKQEFVYQRAETSAGGFAAAEGGDREEPVEELPDSPPLPQPPRDKVEQLPLPEEEKSVSLLRVLAVVWLAGMTIYLAVCLVGYARLRRRILTWARPVEDPALNTIFLNVCREQGLRRPIALLYSRKVGTPLVTGLFHPVVVLPELCCDGRDMAMIFRHELAHCRRGDIAKKLLMVLAKALHWYNPLVWWMAGRCCKDIELACDAEVVKGRSGDFKEAYSDALMTVIRQETGRKLLFSTQFSDGKEILRQRFLNILSGETRRKGTLLCCAALLVVGMLGTLVACEAAGSPEERPGREEGGASSAGENGAASEPDFTFDMGDVWQKEGFLKVLDYYLSDTWPWDYEEDVPAPEPDWEVVFDRDCYELCHGIWDDRTGQYSDAWGGSRVAVLQDPGSDFALLARNYRYPRYWENGELLYEDSWYLRFFKRPELTIEDLEQAEVILGQSVADTIFYLEQERRAVVFSELEGRPLLIEEVDRELLNDIGMIVDMDTARGKLIYGREHRENEESPWLMTMHYYNPVTHLTQVLRENDTFPNVYGLSENCFVVMGSNYLDLYHLLEDGSAEKQDMEGQSLWQPLAAGWERNFNLEIYRDPGRNINAFFYCEYDPNQIKVEEGYYITPLEWRMAVLDNSGSMKEDFAVGLPVWAGDGGPYGMIDATLRDGLLYFGHCVDDGPYNTDRYCLNLTDPAHYLQRTRENISFYNDEGFWEEAASMGYTPEQLEWLKQQGYGREEVFHPSEGLEPVETSPDGRYRFALRSGPEGTGVLYFQDAELGQSYAMGGRTMGPDDYWSYRFLGNEYFYASFSGETPRVYRADAPEAELRIDRLGWVEIAGAAGDGEGNRAVLYQIVGAPYTEDGIAVFNAEGETLSHSNLTRGDGYSYDLQSIEEIYYTEGALYFSTGGEEEYRRVDSEDGSVWRITEKAFEDAGPH